MCFERQQSAVPLPAYDDNGDHILTCWHHSAQDQHYVADMYSPDMRVDALRGVTVDVSTLHDFHGSADNPSLNGTLCHQDLDLALSQRTQAKVDKYREGHAAPGLRQACLPGVNVRTIPRGTASSSFPPCRQKGHPLLRGPWPRPGEAFDVDSDVYCWRRSGNFWRMRASLFLVWRARKPQPSALRSSAALALGSDSDFHNTTLFSGKPLVAVTATRFACKSRAASSLPLYS